MFKQNKQAFTLIELIVVITILAILGTIAFISLQGYSASARDSKRISDISNIKKSLELFSINTGKYPLPDNPNEATFSGSTIWTQGIVGDNMTTNLSRNLNEKPLDPLTEVEYTYSATYSQTEYEVLAIYESDIISYSPHSIFSQREKGDYIIEQTNAATQAYPKIDGTYNQVAVKTPKYIIPTPSIINAFLPVNNEIDLENNIDSQVITGGNNLMNNGVTQTGGLDISFNFYEIPESGNINIIYIGEIIQNTYQDSLLSNIGIYSNIVESSDTGELSSIIEYTVLKKNILLTTSDKSFNNCASGIITGLVFTDISYFYDGFNNLENNIGRGSNSSDSSIKHYSADLFCNNGDISFLTEELDNTTCNDGYIENLGECNPDNYTITLNKNGGTLGTSNVNAIYGNSLPTISIPEKTYNGESIYTFLGYYTSIIGGIIYYDSNGNSSHIWDLPSNTTLYAQWEEVEQFRMIRCDGGVAACPSTYNEIASSFYISGACWSSAMYYRDCKLKNLTSIVTFNRNGGSGGSLSTIASLDLPMPSIEVPTRTYYDVPYYTFLGYYSEIIGGTQYYLSNGNSAHIWDTNINTTLYAQWEEVEQFRMIHCDGSPTACPSTYNEIASGYYITNDCWSSAMYYRDCRLK